MSTSSIEANQANEDWSEFLTDPERFKERFGLSDRVKATDPSQGQGTNVTGPPADELHGYVLSRLSR